MNKKLKILSLLLAILCLVGCSKAKPSNETQSSTENQEYITAKTTSSDKLDLKKDNLPIVLKAYGLEVTAFKATNGSFVENGSNTERNNIASIVVKNISDKDITLAAMSFTVNGEYAAAFNITTLPVGATVTVQESNGLEFNEKDKYKFVTANVTYSDGFEMNEDKVTVSAEGKNLTVKNISSEDYSYIYVYYKAVDSDGNYYGGITYRTKFENVKSGETQTEKTQNYSSNCKIMMVEAY